MLWEVRYSFITAAVAQVSPGGLGEGAWVRPWRKEICASLSAVMVSRRAWESILEGPAACSDGWVAQQGYAGRKGKNSWWMYEI